MLLMSDSEVKPIQVSRASNIEYGGLKIIRHCQVYILCHHSLDVGVIFNFQVSTGCA
jgi:hypothetical protein